MISINMIYITNPQHIWISVVWAIWLLVIQWIISHKQGYRIPKDMIIKQKELVRKWAQIIIIICLFLLPLELTYKNQERKEFIIIGDSSLSMYSEDMYPNRYTIMNQIIKRLKKKYNITYCYSQKILAICKNTIIVPNSWSSASDLLAVALYGSSDSQIMDAYNFLVISDGGINNGIDFDSLFISWNNYKNIYRIDLAPNEEVVISGNSIAKQQLLQTAPPIGENYIKSTKKENVTNIRNSIERLISKKEWAKSINPYLTLITLLSLSFLLSGHILTIIKKPTSIKKVRIIDNT